MAWWNFRKKPEQEQRTVTWTDGGAAFSQWLNQSTVTPDSVTGIPAVFSAVNMLSTNVAKLPLNVWKVNRDGTKQIDRTHPVARLMNVRVNPYQSAFDFVRTAISHYLLWGNAYIDIVWDAKGNPVELWLLNPASTGIVYDTGRGEIYYNTQIPITMEAVVRQSYQLLHLKHYSKTGFIGVSPISCASDMLATQLGMTKFNKKFYDQGTMATQVIQTAEMLNGDAKNNIRAAWENANSGMTNAHRVAILDGGLDIKTIGMPIKDMQFVETQQFNLRQIASIFNIPAIMINDNSGLKYSNTENAMLSFVRETLSPIMTMIEQEFMYKLFRPSEIGRYELEFDTSELTSGDMTTRGAYYKIMKENQIMSTNEIRKLEGLNSVENGDVVVPDPKEAIENDPANGENPKADNQQSQDTTQKGGENDD